MSVSVSHPFGSPNAYNVAQAFQESGRLDSFFTCIYGRGVGARRAHPGLSVDKIRGHGFREWVRVGVSHSGLFKRLGRSTAFKDWVATEFDRWVSRQLARTSSSIIWGYEDFCAETFVAARKLGIRTVYDLPTVHFLRAREIDREEVRREASLRRLMTAFAEPEQRVRRKESELLLADGIVCASTFVKGSLQQVGIDCERVKVIPYGADTGLPPKRWHEKDLEGPLQIFYAGAIAPHKGIHHLFGALADLPPRSIQLTLAGYWLEGFQDWLRGRYRIPYNYVGMLDPKELSTVYRQMHLFIFPSLRDGFGLVLLEALASGIPIAASLHSGAPDIIEEGKEGWLFPAGDPDGLRRTLERALNRRDALIEMGGNARKLVERLTWGAYRAAVASVCGSAPFAMSRD